MTLQSARELAATLNAYESHRLEPVEYAERGVRIAAHTDEQWCSDNGAHEPWKDVAERWPGYAGRLKARQGDLHATDRWSLLAGAEVAVLSDGEDEAVVRYVATDHRWVVEDDQRS